MYKIMTNYLSYKQTTPIIVSVFLSFTMRGPVRKVLDIFLKNEEQFRVTYMLGACGSLGSVFVFWMPMPYEIWNIQQQELRMTLTGEWSSNLSNCRTARKFLI